MEILGIDIGGSGIKGAPVDVKKGTLVRRRYRIPTPLPSVPEAIAGAVAELVAHFDWQGPVGCTFPAVVKNGTVYTAANVDEAWLGVDGQKLLHEATGCPLVLINDADAAGLAEMQFGAGRKRKGVVFVLTFGTGIGSAIFVDGVLMPNVELGHITMVRKAGGPVDAELYASDRARTQHRLKWSQWANRVNQYLGLLEFLFSPDLFILGGGVSKKHLKFVPLLTARAEIVPAQLLNEAGIVGAALAARKLVGR